MYSFASYHRSTAFDREGGVTAHVLAPGAPVEAIRIILAMAVRMTGAQGAVLTCVRGQSHLPLASVDLSKVLVSTIVRQMSGWRLENEGTSMHVIPVGGRNPLFAICISVQGPGDAPQPAWVLSFIMTGDNLLDRCSLADLEQLAAELAVLLAPSGQTAAGPAEEAPLPTCCMCDHLQGEQGQWQPWQRFVQQTTGRMLSHTFCPRCMSSHYPELLDVS